MPGLLDNVTDAQLDARRSHSSYGLSERTLYGVTATFVDTDTGALLTETFSPGRQRESARCAAERCIALGPSWRIRSLSHPLAILHDLDNNGRERYRQAEGNMLGRYRYLIEYEAAWGGMGWASRPTRTEQRHRAEHE